MSNNVVNAYRRQNIEDWVVSCFGIELATDQNERNQRFLEEAVELVQACNLTRSQAHQLVDYVYNRPVGEKGQEVAGTFVSLIALCAAQGIDIDEEVVTEIERIWEIAPKILEKQKLKPRFNDIPFDHNAGVDIHQY